MAGCCVYLSSVFLLVLVISIHPSRCLECNDDTVDACERRTEDCPHAKHMIECLKNLDECTDDGLQLYVDSQLNFLGQRVAHCPDLPDGTCYYNLHNACTKQVPYDVVYRVLSDKKKKELCDAWKGKSTNVKNCLEAIRPHCTPSSPQQAEITKSIKTLNKIDAACAGI